MHEAGAGSRAELEVGALRAVGPYRYDTGGNCTSQPASPTLLFEGSSDFDVRDDDEEWPEISKSKRRGICGMPCVLDIM